MQVSTGPRLVVYAAAKVPSNSSQSASRCSHGCTLKFPGSVQAAGVVSMSSGKTSQMSFLGQKP
eukprot:3917275-Amphidinium_carterae.1